MAAFTNPNPTTPFILSQQFLGITTCSGEGINFIIADAGDWHKDYQHPYHGRCSIHSGEVEDARTLCDAIKHHYGPEGLTLLTWLLGAHLAGHVGFWPHLVVSDGDRSSYQLINDLKGLLPLCYGNPNHTQPYDGQHWNEVTILRMVRNSSFPVVVNAEFQAASTHIDTLLLLMKKYHGRAGRAPMLVLGSAPDRQLYGMACKMEMPDREIKGEFTSLKHPFPMWQWLLYLSTFTNQQAFDMAERLSGPEGGVTHLGQLLLAWEMLCDFCGLPDDPAVREALGNMEIPAPPELLVQPAQLTLVAESPLCQAQEGIALLSEALNLCEEFTERDSRIKPDELEALETLISNGLDLVQQMVYPVAVSDREVANG